MSRLVARIMLALIMLPLAAMVYTITAVVLASRRYWSVSEERLFLWGTIVTAVFVVAYWLLLWRGTVRWTRSRVLLTVAVTAATLLGGAGLSAIIGRLIEDSFGIFVGGALAILGWLALTVLVWRETRGERVLRLRTATRDGAVVCPACGYSMTG
ncbi:MAG: hypothetical protein ACYTJ0_14020, partial [Planctomycetota bacterium]